MYFFPNFLTKVFVPFFYFSKTKMHSTSNCVYCSNYIHERCIVCGKYKASPQVLLTLPPPRYSLVVSRYVADESSAATVSPIPEEEDLPLPENSVLRLLFVDVPSSSSASPTTFKEKQQMVESCLKAGYRAKDNRRFSSLKK